MEETKYGISRSTLAWWRKRPVTDADVKALSKDEAINIHEVMFVKGPGFDKLPDGVLKSNMIDFGVMSGPTLAVMNLQELLGVDADGVLGPLTLAALSNVDHAKLNLAIAKKRILMMGRLCAKHPAQLPLLNSWLTRALSFI